MQQSTVNRIVLAVLLAIISGLFVWVLRPFLMPIFLAALFTALFYPLYRRFEGLTGQRKGLASAVTLLSLLLFVFLPLSWVATIAAGQAVEIFNNARPWVQQEFAEPGSMTRWLSKLPFYEQLLPYREKVLEQLGVLAGSLGSVGVNLLESLTRSTIQLVINVVVMLYTMFFLFTDGKRFLYFILYYLPLNDEDESLLMDRFTSVARATLKGTAVIGFLQGTAAGIGLYLAGIPSALFWSLVMMLLSVVPGVGAALIWVPAVIWLLISGKVMAGLALGAWCALVVGSLDNLLRPKLVGNDTQLHELMIFFSTLGGILVFGFTGFIIGPIIAALFQTLWELYGIEFRQWLPRTHLTLEEDESSPDIPDSIEDIRPPGKQSEAHPSAAAQSPKQPPPGAKPRAGEPPA